MPDYRAYVAPDGDYEIPPAGTAAPDTTSTPVTPPPSGTDQTSVSTVDAGDIGQPQDPYSGATPDQGGPLLPKVRQQSARALDDVAGATKDESNAINDTQLSSFDAEMAKHKAEAAKADAQSQVQQQYANNLGTIDAYEAAARDQAHKDASMETASWMQQMDNLSKQEPNRARYWENQSGFGKAMWILGVAATAIANSGHPGMPNASLNLLQEQVQADVQDQKDRLSRQIDTGKLKGKMMVDAQNQRLTDLHDDYAKEVTRYGALRDAAITKASVYPPGTQQNLSWTAAAQQADQLRTQAAQKKLQSTIGFKEQAITQAGENSRAAASRANAYAIARMEDNSKRDIANQTNKRDYDLAQERIDAAVAAKSAGAKSKFEFNIPVTSGFSVVKEATNPGETSTVRPLGIHEKQIDKAPQEAAAFGVRLKQMKVLREKLADASTFAYMTNSDAALRAAEMDAKGSAAKEINGGGRLTDKDIANGAISNTGTDIDSVFDKLRQGTDRKQALALLDSKIADIGSEAQGTISTKYGSDLQPGEKLVFDPEQAYNNLKGTAAKGPTADEQEAKAGYGDDAIVPKTEDEYRKYRKEQETFGKGLLRQLPQELNEKLGDAIDNMANGDVTHVAKVITGANEALDAYAAKNPKQAGAVADAKLRLHAEAVDATKLALGKIPEIEQKTIATALYTNKRRPEAEDLEIELKHANLDNISTYRKSQMLAEINKALDAYTAKHAHPEMGMAGLAGLKPTDAIEEYNAR